MALCTVTGAVYLPNGELARSTMIKFTRVDKSVNAEYLGAVVPADVYTKTDRLGQVDFEILTGRYIMHVAEYSGGAVVPDSLTADIADVLTIITPSVPVPAWLTQALAARDAASASADAAQASADDAAASAAAAAADAVVGAEALVVANRAEGKADDALVDASAANLVAARARDAAGVVPQQFGDGAGGWQVAINAAIEALSSGQGGKLVLPDIGAPYEISSPIIVRSSVEVDFGKASIRLANGGDCDIIQTEGFYSLTGTNNFAVNGSPNGFTLTGGLFDGNRANQSPADPDACNGLALYGYGFTLKDMEFRNVRGNGYRGEWGQFGGETVGHSMESTIENVRFDTSGRRGFWHKGPHDANVSHLIVIDASQEADDAYDGILNEGFGGARWYNPHVWHRSAATNRARWAGNFAGGGNEIMGGHFEGCRRQYRTTGNNQAFGVLLYAPRSDNAQIELSGERNILFGRFANSTQNPRPVVLSLGDTTTAGLSNVELVAGVGAGTTNPVVRVVASVGNNKIRVQATGAATPSTFFTGSFDDFDEVHLHQEFPARVAYRKLPFIASGAPPDPAAPGQYHFYTPSTGTARPIWRNGANTAWVDANGAIVSIA